jgi:hypothetical protein
MLGSFLENLAKIGVDWRLLVRIVGESPIALWHQNPHLFQTTSFELCQTQESSIDQTKNLKLHSLAI